MPGPAKRLLLGIYLALIAFSLIACAGGARYRAEFYPEGTPKQATARVSNDSDSVALDVESRGAGKGWNLHFDKRGTSGARQMIEALGMWRSLGSELVGLRGREAELNAESERIRDETLDRRIRETQRLIEQYLEQRRRAPGPRNP